VQLEKYFFPEIHVKADPLFKPDPKERPRFNVDVEVSVAGVSYRLLNVPYYAAGQLEEYVAAHG